MHYEASVDIGAPAEAAWRVLTDVEAWPQWTPTVTKSERLDKGDLAVDSRVRLTQPKLPPAVWRVSVLEEPGYFEWRNTNPLLKTVAGHRVQAGRSENACRVTLSINQTGLLSGIMARMYGALTKQYVDTEAQALKARCEA